MKTESEQLNPYEILGLNKTGLMTDGTVYDQTEILRAYKQRALATHPDKNTTSDTQAQFRAVREAYEVLKNADTRASIDLALRKKNPLDPQQVELQRILAAAHSDQACCDLAIQERRFAKALCSDSVRFRAFPLKIQFTLFLWYYHHRIDADHVFRQAGRFFETLWNAVATVPSVLYAAPVARMRQHATLDALLRELVVNEQYQDAFIRACSMFPHPEVVEQLLAELGSEYITQFSVSSLSRLAMLHEQIVPILLTKNLLEISSDHRNRLILLYAYLNKQFSQTISPTAPVNTPDSGESQSQLNAYEAAWQALHVDKVSPEDYFTQHKSLLLSHKLRALTLLEELPGVSQAIKNRSLLIFLSAMDEIKHELTRAEILELLLLMGQVHKDYLNFFPRNYSGPLTQKRFAALHEFVLLSVRYEDFLHYLQECSQWHCMSVDLDATLRRRLDQASDIHSVDFWKDISYAILQRTLTEEDQAEFESLLVDSKILVRGWCKIRNSFHSKPWPTASYLRLYPLVLAGSCSEKDIENILQDSIQQRVYQQIANSVPIAVGSASSTRSFFQSAEYNFLCSTVFQAIDTEIIRLQNESGSFFSQAGNTKVVQLNQVKMQLQNRLESCIVNTLILQGMSQKATIQEAYMCVFSVIQEAVVQPEICAQRNRVGAFLKGLGAVLLAAPCLFIPLTCSRYRNLFFGVHTVHALCRVANQIQHDGMSPVVARI